MELLEKLKIKGKEIIKEYNIKDKIVKVKARVLTPEEAIGNPEHNDYPLLKGKERLIEAEYENAKGVAFTDMYGNYEASLYEIFEMELKNNFRRAIFIATLNAILRFTGLITNTIHCKDNEPVKCARKLQEKFLKEYKGLKVFLVGYQPRFGEVLTKYFETRITDMDRDNIGRKINGVEIEPPDKENENIKWCDIVFVTGSSFVNNTAEKYIRINKKVIFYGVTCAGATYLLNLDRFCPFGK